MSRLDDTIRRDLQVIADRATPSPDAWNRILHGIDDQAPDTDTEIIMLTDNTLPTRRWPLLAAAAALIVVAIGAIIVFGTGGDDDPVPAVEPEEVVPDEAIAVPAPGSQLAAGDYSTEGLGVPIEFEVPAPESAPWTVEFSNAASFSINGGDGFIAMTRIGSFFDSDEAFDPDMSGLGSLPPDGVDEWIERNEIIVDESTEVTVDGRTAQFRQIRLPAGIGGELCPAEAKPCISLATSSADLIDQFPDQIRLGSERPQTFWFIEMDDFEPLGIWIQSFGPDSEAWLDQAMPLIESIQFGDPAPAVEDGTARVSEFAVGLPAQGSQVAAGNYSTDSLGVSIDFEVPSPESAPWTVEFSNAASFSINGGDGFVAVTRIGSYLDEVEAFDPEMRGLGSLPADGIDAWIELHDIIVDESTEVTVDGRAAHYRQIRLPAGIGGELCPAEAKPCISMSTASADLIDQFPDQVRLGSERPHTFWIIELDDFEPLGIWVQSFGPDAQAWLDQVTPLVESIQLGDPAPAVEGGTARVGG